jgi:hypothetical protein
MPARRRHRPRAGAPDAEERGARSQSCDSRHRIGDGDTRSHRTASPGFSGPHIAASSSKKPQPLCKLLLDVPVEGDLVDGQADRWACKIGQPDKQHERCEGHANEQGNDRKGLHGITRIDNIGILSCGEMLINGIAGINPS